MTKVYCKNCKHISRGGVRRLMGKEYYQCRVGMAIENKDFSWYNGVDKRMESKHPLPSQTYCECRNKHNDCPDYKEKP